MSDTAAAAAKFVEKTGQKDTTVHEAVAPAVTQETIIPKRHEEATTAFDTEIHQEHYHTSVLPIQHSETLPEKHEYITQEVEHKEHHHGDADALKRLLAEEAAVFKDSHSEAEAIVTTQKAPTVKGEHVHHHVHEFIQPVIQKEVIVPTVVHTTIPIREVHHNEAVHHAATSLPPITLAEFHKQGGSLTGREARVETFAGEPRAAGETTSNVTAAGLVGAGAGAGVGGDVSPGRPLARSTTGKEGRTRGGALRDERRSSQGSL